jgi:hypothetical protein
MGDTRFLEPVSHPLEPSSAQVDSVLGTYLHGLFENDAVRAAFVRTLFDRAGLDRPQVPAAEASPYDRAADLLETHVDEEWLDGTVPGWGSMNESTLADEVTAHAEETEYPQVFEDTTGSHDHDGHAHGRAGGTRDLSEAMLSQAEAELDDLETRDTEDVLEQARELTEKRHADESSETE